MGMESKKLDRTLTPLTQAEVDQRKLPPEQLWFLKWDSGEIEGPYWLPTLQEYLHRFSDFPEGAMACHAGNKQWLPLSAHSQLKANRPSDTPPKNWAGPEADRPSEPVADGRLWLLVKGQKLGPLRAEKLEELIQKRALNFSDLVSKDGGKTWEKVFHYINVELHPARPSLPKQPDLNKFVMEEEPGPVEEIFQETNEPDEVTLPQFKRPLLAEKFVDPEVGAFWSKNKKIVAGILAVVLLFAGYQFFFNSKSDQLELVTLPEKPKKRIGPSRTTRRRTPSARIERVRDRRPARKKEAAPINKENTVAPTKNATDSFDSDEQEADYDRRELAESLDEKVEDLDLEDVDTDARGPIPDEESEYFDADAEPVPEPDEPGDVSGLIESARKNSGDIDQEELESFEE